MAAYHPRNEVIRFMPAGASALDHLAAWVVRWITSGTAEPLAAPGRAGGPGTPAQRNREPELEEPEPATQSKRDQVRAGMAALLEANWREVKEGGWSARQMTRAIKAKTELRAGVDYSREWLAGEYKACLELRRLAESAGGAEEAEPWWAGDEVAGRAGAKKGLLPGKRGTLVRPGAQGRTGSWTIRAEGAAGTVELDVSTDGLELVRRRALTEGDTVEARLVEAPHEGGRARVRLIKRAEDDSVEGETWWARAVADTAEPVRVVIRGARRAGAVGGRATRWAVADAAPRAGEQEQREGFVDLAQRAYRLGGDWRCGEMKAAMQRIAPEAAPAADGELQRAIDEAKRRWHKGPAALRAVTINHGGVVTRLREAIAAARGLRRQATQPDAREAAALVWQADGRFYSTMGTLAADNDMVLIQEHHLRAKDSELLEQLVALLTTGEFDQWRVIVSPAPDDDPYAGVLIWYNTEAVEVAAIHAGGKGAHAADGAVPGRLQRVRVRVRADGTRFQLANVYAVPRAGSPSAAQLERTRAVRKGLQVAANEAQEAGEELLIAGDLQAQTARALNASRADGNEYDTWLEMFTTENCMMSVGEVDVTYSAGGEGGATTCIDHWLASAGLFARVEAEVGAGADGLHTGTAGEAADTAIGATAAKGHNSLQLRLLLETATTEGAEEELEQREAQLAPMDDAEWEAYAQEEEAVVAAAEGSVKGDEPGQAARRLEAMEAGMKALVVRIKELDERRGGTRETKQVRLHKRMLRWRRWLKACDGHRSYPDEHPAFNDDEGCGGVFGAAPRLDAAFAAVVASSGRGHERRCALREECRRRYLAARSAYDGEIAAGGADKDRVRTRLLDELHRAREAGGSGQWEFFRAVARAKAALGGKRTRPRDGRPGMTAVRRAGEAEPVTGAAAVLAAIHEESKAMHQEGGAAVAATLRMVAAMEADGLPMLRPAAVIDARSEEEEKAGAEADAERKRATENTWAEWRRWRGEHKGLDAREALDAEKAQELTKGLRRLAEHILTEEALEQGMERFRDVQGVGVGGFKGIWIARAGPASRARYVAALRGVAVDLRAAASELERASTPTLRRVAMEAVRHAAPEGWTAWLVILLTKPGKALDVLSKRRDIYLQPHSLKLFMNGVKPHYDAAQRAAQPATNTGFRPGGSATQSGMTMGLMREEAVSERAAWYRGYCDKGGFFQSVARRMQHATERLCDVTPDVTEIVMALHDCLMVRYDSGAGLTPGTESEVGNGQGDTDGPTRSMEPLAIETRAIEWLVAGRAMRTPAGVERRRVVSIFFADDGAFEVDTFENLQKLFTVISALARPLGFTIGIDTDADGTPNGDKTVLSTKQDHSWAKQPVVSPS